MTVKLGNCKRCGKLYLRMRDFCDDCYQKQEDDFLKVAEYLRDHPGIIIQELSEETQVSILQIRQFILEGRILVGNFPNLSYPCENCGTMIRTGKTCDICNDTLQQLSMQNLQEEKEFRQKVSEHHEKRNAYITHKL